MHNGMIQFEEETMAKSVLRPGDETVRFALPGVALEENVART